jgi:3-hydroxybutyryl-CoA dehydratase
MLAGSMFSGVFANKFPGAGTIYLEQSLEFKKPILVGAELELRLHVLSQIGRKLLVETNIYVDNVLCVSGNAKLLISKTQSRGVN